MYRSLQPSGDIHPLLRSREMDPCMRPTNAFLPFILLTLVLYSSAATPNGLPAPFIYAHPIPGAEFVPTATTIAIRASAEVLRSSIIHGTVLLNGERSGKHTASLQLSDDGRTFIITPDMPFVADETVYISLSGTLRTVDGSTLPECSFSFRCAPERSGAAVPSMIEIERDEIAAEKKKRTKKQRLTETIDAPVDYVPPGLITITHSTVPSAGDISFSSFKMGPTDFNSLPYLLLMKNDGQLQFARQMSTMCYGFQQQPSGAYTYWNGDFVVLDSLFVLQRHITCQYGYSTDPHELLELPNGHWLLLGIDFRTMDMSTVVDGGMINADVIGLVIQELDASDNVVFQWRSFDHYGLTDATFTDFSQYTIDAVHGNALELDADGNILLSSRNLDEITKIDRNTGNILWRLGGKNNQFTFINDTIGFSRQHAVRRTAAGTITLFDNGNNHTPQYSRAVEYALDEKKHTATLVWSFRNTPDIYGNAFGYVQRLKNGNTFISWGAATPSLTEVTPSGETVFEMCLPEGIYTYRAFKQQPEESPAAVPSPSAIPANITLYQNFPNPFNPATTIRYTLTGPGTVKVSVYDMLGRESAVLVNGPQEAGEHSVPWDAGSMASGVYFYKLQTENSAITKRMHLVR